MAESSPLGIEAARKSFPALVDQAASGRSQVIARHGKPVAALVPLSQLAKVRGGSGVLALRGSGRGLWGRKAAATVADLRDEWGA